LRRLERVESPQCIVSEILFLKKMKNYIKKMCVTLNDNL
jgi:hypothetical protein